MQEGRRGAKETLWQVLPSLPSRKTLLRRAAPLPHLLPWLTQDPPAILSIPVASVGVAAVGNGGVRSNE